MSGRAKPDPRYKMAAVTVWQPYARAITRGLQDIRGTWHVKDVENRNMATLHRGPVLIHAGQRFDPNALADTGKRMGAGVPFSPLHSTDFDQLGEVGAIVGAACLVTTTIGGGSLAPATKKSLGPWFDQRYRVAWALALPIYFTKPVPCRGRQGLWYVYADTLPGWVLERYLDLFDEFQLYLQGQATPRRPREVGEYNHGDP